MQHMRLTNEETRDLLTPLAKEWSIAESDEVIFDGTPAHQQHELLRLFNGLSELDALAALSLANDHRTTCYPCC